MLTVRVTVVDCGKETAFRDPLSGPSGSSGEPGTEAFWSGRRAHTCDAVYLHTWNEDRAENRGEATVKVIGCEDDYYQFITLNTIRFPDISIALV